VIVRLQVLQDVGHHNNVVKLVGVSFEPPCLVMELVENAQEMDKYLVVYRRSHTGLQYVQVVCQVLLDVACGVAYIHRHNIVHRDLAARNVLVNKATGIAKVNDFGLSSVVSRRPSDNIAVQHSLIDPDAAFFRAAPENFGIVEFKGQQLHLFQSDSFMFGMLMWEALCECWQVESPNNSFWCRGYSMWFEEGWGLPDDAELNTATRGAKFGSPVRRGIQDLADHLLELGIAEVTSLVEINMSCLRYQYYLRLPMDVIATQLTREIDVIQKYAAGHKTSRPRGNAEASLNDSDCSVISV